MKPFSGSSAKITDQLNNRFFSRRVFPTFDDVQNNVINPLDALTKNCAKMAALRNTPENRKGEGVLEQCLKRFDSIFKTQLTESKDEAVDVSPPSSMYPQ